MLPRVRKSSRLEVAPPASVKQKPTLPRIQSLQADLPSRNTRESIGFQCRLVKQRSQERSASVMKETAPRQPNASVVIEAREEQVDDAQKLDDDDFTHEETFRRLKAERHIDEIIRSNKASFRRSRTSNASRGGGTNISNVGGDSISLVNTQDQSTGQDDSLQVNPGSIFPNDDSTATEESTDSRNTTIKSELSVPLKSDSNFALAPPTRFDATAEFVQIPYSGERSRIPPKKILPVKHLPTDPLAKYRKEKQEFSLGFKVTERTESNKTLNDYEQNHLVALIRLCEAYTKNLGPEYLISLARESVVPLETREHDAEKRVDWHGGTKIVHDATERMWNWDKSMINSNTLRDFQGRPIYNKTLDIRNMSQSPDQHQGSLGPNDYDAKSDLGDLLIRDSDSSTDMEFDESDFIAANAVHPFADSIVLAGGTRNTKAKERYIQRKRTKKNVSLSTAGIVSPMESVHEEEEEEAKHEAGQDAAVNDQSKEEPQVLSPLPSGADAENTSKSPPKTTTETTITSTSATSVSPSDEKHKASSEHSSQQQTTHQPKHRRHTSQQKSGVRKRPKRTRFVRRNRSEGRPRDPIEMPNDFPVDNLQSGFENVAIDWCKIVTSSGAPNPIFWFEAMDAMEHFIFDKASLDSDRQIQAHEVFGLGKRFISVAGGLSGLHSILKKTVEPGQPKAEMLLDCMVKNYKLQMPLAVGDASRLRELYVNTIVKNPMLYKMVLKRRDILPEDVQAFVAKIIETTESSDATLAALYPSKTTSEMIVSAAKEMFASGYLAGGPPCPVSRSSAVTGSAKKPEKASGDDATEDDDEEVESRGEESANTPQEDGSNTSTAFVAYGSEVNYEKAFNIGLINPCKDILQEVAYFIPEFAFHTRPLFETKWIEIGRDRSFEKMLPELCELRNMRQRRMEMLKLGLIFTEKEERDEAVRVRELSFDLVERLCRLLNYGNTDSSCGVWMCLLACCHSIMFWPPIGDFLIARLTVWIPALLLTLQSEYATVREEGCCIIAFLACCYPIFCRLQMACRNLLISNMTYALLDAMERHPESYACFHGTLAYVLHSLPCNAVLDCLLAWIPGVIERGSESKLAQDWPLFFYYVSRHWPGFATNWNLLYDRQILRLLEKGALAERVVSKHNARLALGYFARRRRLISSVMTAWMQQGEGSETK